MSMKDLWTYLQDQEGSFTAEQADQTSRLFFPLMNESGMKCSVTPELKGDISVSFAHYLMPPVVTEDLSRTNNSRYVWFNFEGAVPWAINGLSPDQQALKWSDHPEEHRILAKPGEFTLIRKHHSLPIEAEISLFVPHSRDQVELWKVKLRNTGSEDIRYTPFVAVPLFGRHADNIRDHRQVTSMFQYTTRLDHGVRLKPSIVHDEHGHRINEFSYFAMTFKSDGTQPDRVWTRMQDFIGEGGSMQNPQAVFQNLPEPELADEARHGVDAIAAMSFRQETLAAGEEEEFFVLLGLTNQDDEQAIFSRYNDTTKFEEAFAKTRVYWSELTHQVAFDTGQPDFDEWTKWLAFQLKCRQIYGNSFLPDFGYGRGGRGWRDLWQDLLSIFLVDPESAQFEIINNLKGIRIDGSNATIIGNRPGEFKADRNNIPRTWCDHGAWPLFALNFYIQQSGDFSVLLQEIEYWKDMFVFRSKDRDKEYSEEDGTWLLTKSGDIYQGSVLEHVLIQQLSAFFNVGEHNILLLEGADWNDTLDMARNRGESACFQSFYAGNFGILINLLETLKEQGIQSISLLEEVLVLLDRTMSQTGIDYDRVSEKRELINRFFETVRNRVSGTRKEVLIGELIADLSAKEYHTKQKIRTQEWIQTEDGGFFNGHYDDQGTPMHGKYPEGWRMDLTSQVMPTMFDVADDEQVKALYQSSKKHLGQAGDPGLRLCTPYPEFDMNIGRITGFAYGYKEHGSKWMQQNIMFMYGLFHRNQFDAGFSLFEDIFSLCDDSASSRTFPGIPSYYEPDNRGAYMYLTGSSTWIFLTLVAQIFGIRGQDGDLLINPKISPWFFDNKGEASVSLHFRGQPIRCSFYNPKNHPVGEYKITRITINDQSYYSGHEHSVLVGFNEIKTTGKGYSQIHVFLG